MTDDRRKSERVRLPLDMSWEGLSGRHPARVYDLCEDGCYVETIGQATVGEKIQFEVELPTGRRLRLQAEVIHSQPNLGFGVRLLQVPEADRQMLGQLIEYGRGE